MARFLATLVKTAKDRVAAMPSRFDNLLWDAARMMEPEIQKVKVSSQVLKTGNDMDAWLATAKEILIEKLTKAFKEKSPAAAVWGRGTLPAARRRTCHGRFQECGGQRHLHRYYG